MWICRRVQGSTARVLTAGVAWPWPWPLFPVWAGCTSISVGSVTASGPGAGSSFFTFFVALGGIVLKGPPAAQAMV